MLSHEITVKKFFVAGDIIILNIVKSSRRQVINLPADLSHHRAYRSVHGGSNTIML